MKNRLHYFIFLLLAVQCLLLTANAQTPTVEKIEPPSWWTNSSMKTVRVMIRGTNLTGAKVAAPQTGGLQASNVKSSQNGHYLFFDATIPESTKVGKYNLKFKPPAAQ
jgi:hypothetical protein